ncbi:MAG: hypothetical protein AB8B61_04480, partial [Cyclobacteriaceae bacterium]
MKEQLKQISTIGYVILFLVCIAMYNNITHLASEYGWVENKHGGISQVMVYLVNITFDLIVIVGIILGVKWIEWLFSALVFVISFFHFDLHQTIYDWATIPNLSKATQLDYFKDVCLSLLYCTVFSVLIILLGQLFTVSKEKHLASHAAEELQEETTELQKVFARIQHLCGDNANIPNTDAGMILLDQVHQELNELRTFKEQFLHCGTCDQYFKSQQ